MQLVKITIYPTYRGISLDCINEEVYFPEDLPVRAIGRWVEDNPRFEGLEITEIEKFEKDLVLIRGEVPDWVLGKSRYVVDSVSINDGKSLPPDKDTIFTTEEVVVGEGYVAMTRGAFVKLSSLANNMNWNRSNHKRVESMKLPKVEVEEVVVDNNNDNNSDNNNNNNNIDYAFWGTRGIEFIQFISRTIIGLFFRILTAVPRYMLILYFIDRLLVMIFGVARFKLRMIVEPLVLVLMIMIDTDAFHITNITNTFYAKSKNGVKWIVNSAMSTENNLLIRSIATVILFTLTLFPTGDVMMREVQREIEEDVINNEEQ